MQRKRNLQLSGCPISVVLLLSCTSHDSKSIHFAWVLLSTSCSLSSSPFLLLNLVSTVSCILIFGMKLCHNVVPCFSFERPSFTSTVFAISCRVGGWSVTLSTFSVIHATTFANGSRRATESVYNSYFRSLQQQQPKLLIWQLQTCQLHQTLHQTSRLQLETCLSD